MSRLIEYDYKPGEELSVRVNLREAKPMGEETANHMRSAVREVLMAMRSGLDRAISTLEREPASESEQNQGARRITVE
jgi:hypothetical protein